MCDVQLASLAHAFTVYETNSLDISCWFYENPIVCAHENLVKIWFETRHVCQVKSVK